MGKLAGEVDPAIAALISDLKERGRLDKTLVVWMGEFGRTRGSIPAMAGTTTPRSSTP
ncbi:MAG: DUF1501 domain-containing protein [Planctomycetales bacterium]